MPGHDFLAKLDQMSPDQLRAFAVQLLSQVDSPGQQVDRMGKKNDRDQTIIEQLTHEIAWFKRNKFAKRSEQLSPAQGSLLDDLLDTDIAAIEAELKALNPPAAPAEPRSQPRRAPLPAQFPRTVIHHEPENTQRRGQQGYGLKKPGSSRPMWGRPLNSKNGLP
jgi:transposase